MPETVTNWFGNITSTPAVVVEASSVDDIVAIMKDPGKYPSPVRAVGSNHSTSPCGTADGGTLIKMSKLNAILGITSDSVTAQGGAIYIDIAKELEKQRLQFYVNTEIGSLSAGSAACCGTKDASMPGEFGQVNSYIDRIKMVLPTGDLLEIGDDNPELMQKVRSSYGTFGIVYEATFRVRPILPMAVRHETYSLEEFTSRLAEFKQRGESMMFYIFPFDNLITIEFRHYNPAAEGEPNRVAWPLRNYLWASAGPLFCAQVERDIADKDVRYGVINSFGALWRFKLENLVTSDNTIATDQIIRYPVVANDSRYTFSLSAFPEATYPGVLADYFTFCRQYYQQKGYRTNMLTVGYWISQDRSSLLSYSYDSPVMTIDPVSTGNPGWHEFLVAYNQFCSAHGGIPLFNQTDGITPVQVQQALGDRLKTFAEVRKSYDPGGRLLNPYFRDMLADL
ncbi:MAG TPA: FAD-binding oxidoreductase [Candidatus Acidoferrales bacterium]|nr:FAD-binding oxidoreductase [Candidatus Acidoferrales bacterium]